MMVTHTEREREKQKNKYKKKLVANHTNEDDGDVTKYKQTHAHTDFVQAIKKRQIKSEKVRFGHEAKN